MTLSGSAEMTIDGEKLELTPEVMVRVGPAASRHIAPGPDGARILALGAVPGEPYETDATTELGQPDPLLS